MWAMVKAGQVTAIYSRPKAITVDGIQHPSTIFTSWTTEQKKAFGIYDYSEVNASPNNRYYKQGTSETVVNDSAGTVVKTWSNVALDLADTGSKGDDNYSPGVKTKEKLKVKAQSDVLLNGSDWMAIRAAEGGTAVPSTVATYRAAVRTKSNSMETAVDNASDMAAVIALDVNTYHANGDINVVATLQDWPEVPDVLK